MKHYFLLRSYYLPDHCPTPTDVEILEAETDDATEALQKYADASGIRLKNIKKLRDGKSISADRDDFSEISLTISPEEIIVV